MKQEARTAASSLMAYSSSVLCPSDASVQALKSGVPHISATRDQIVEIVLAKRQRGPSSRPSRLFSIGGAPRALEDAVPPEPTWAKGVSRRDSLSQMAFIHLSIKDGRGIRSSNKAARVGRNGDRTISIAFFLRRGAGVEH